MNNLLSNPKMIDIMQNIAESYSGPGATGKTVLQGMWDDYVNGTLADTEWLEDMEITEKDVVNILATLSLIANVIGLDKPVAGTYPF
jgi:hypothetical protein